VCEVQRKRFWQDQMKTCRLGLYGGTGVTYFIA